MVNPQSPSLRQDDAQRGAMRTGCIVAAVIVGVFVAAFFFLTIGNYNQLINRQEQAKAAWTEIQNQYQRRYDLIPNLVETVKGAAGFEQETLTQVTEARAKVGQVRLPDQLPQDPQQLQAYIQAQQGLSGALSRLFAVAENYPQLRATGNFVSLQDQIEGTENRITVARRDYIDRVQAYNVLRRSFPTNMMAGAFGFEALAQLPIEEEKVREAPKVNFGDGK